MSKHYLTVADIPLVEYKLLQKYVSSYTLLLFFYKKILAGNSYYDILLNTEEEQLTKLLHKPFKLDKGGRVQEKEQVNEVKLKRFQKKLPRVNLSFEDIVPMGNTIKKWQSIYTDITNVLAKGIVINIHSELGEEALKGGSILTEKLGGLATSDFKINIINGFQLNNLMVDFDTDISSLVDGQDLLVIFSINSVQATDFRKEKLASLFDYAKLKKVPIICTSKDEFKQDGINVINCKLKDEVKTESALFDEVFGKKK